MSEFVAGSNNEESPPAEEMVSGAGGPGASPGHTANAMTAARNALTAALLAGRRCAICDKPTGAGWRKHCSSRYCLATVIERRNERRRAAYRQQQTG